IIKTIRESPDVEVARDRLMANFGLTEIQAQAILDMQLRRLTGLERQKLEEEYAELLKTISYLEGLLASPLQQRQVIRQDLIELREHYADLRRTAIRPNADASLDEEDLVEEEDVLIAITQRGYIKRMPWTTFRAQGRGGRGVIGMATGDEDEITTLLSAYSHDTLLFFTDKGKVYQEKVYQIPDAGRTAKGSLIAGILAVGVEEHVTAVVPVSSFEETEDGGAHYLSMITRKGRIKRIALSEFSAVRPSGLIAISLYDGDELGWVRLTQGNDDLILVTEQGQGLRFHEQDARPMGRSAAGVIAIRMNKDDRLTVAEVVEPQGALFLVSLKGYGRCTVLDEFRTQGRGGKGVIAYRINDMTGPIVDGRAVQDDDEITLMSEGGIVLRTRVDKIPKMGRYTRGVQMMDLKDGDRVASLARLPSGGANNGNGDTSNGNGEENPAMNKDEGIGE
ncbi:MAG: DNA gyrase subunit A, partial [Anaerolineae bacterium]|nr:DNA gyrase subunit A [Anaerolineae bacterium]